MSVRDALAETHLLRVHTPFSQGGPASWTAVFGAARNLFTYRAPARPSRRVETFETHVTLPRIAGAGWCVGAGTGM